MSSFDGQIPATEAVINVKQGALETKGFPKPLVLFNPIVSAASNNLAALGLLKIPPMQIISL
jgi:hypothetical protein